MSPVLYIYIYPVLYFSYPFLFNGYFYDQIDGVAMGSLLAPILANLFMGFHEEQWLNNYTDSLILFYRRYVDDTFCVFNNEQDAMLFLDYLNTRHPNIRFTYEKQLEGKLPFLDILVDNSSPFCTMSTYHKKTYTGLLTNYFSFTSFKYKIGLIHTLVDRAFKINNTNSGFRKDLVKLTETLKRNSFPLHIIDKTIKRYLDNFQPNSSSDNSISNSNNASTRYFKLPFIGNVSNIT